MRKRHNLGLYFALAAGGLYLWKWYKVRQAAAAALAAPSTVSGAVVQSARTGSGGA